MQLGMKDCILFVSDTDESAYCLRLERVWAQKKHSTWMLESNILRRADKLNDDIKDNLYSLEERV
jgi:hypothetical protein